VSGRRVPIQRRWMKGTYGGRWRMWSGIQVRAQLVERAEEWAWSSAALRKTGGGGGLVDLSVWRERYDWPRWAEALRTSIDEEAFGRRLQEASRKGRPMGGDEFVDELEERSGRRLRAQPVGRPRRVSEGEEEQMVLGNCV
jgi:putative transposase